MLINIKKAKESNWHPNKILFYDCGEFKDSIFISEIYKECSDRGIKIIDIHDSYKKELRDATFLFQDVFSLNIPKYLKLFNSSNIFTRFYGVCYGGSFLPENEYHNIYGVYKYHELSNIMICEKTFFTSQEIKDRFIKGHSSIDPWIFRDKLEVNTNPKEIINKIFWEKEVITNL